MTIGEGTLAGDVWLRLQHMGGNTSRNRLLRIRIPLAIMAAVPILFMASTLNAPSSFARGDETVPVPEFVSVAASSANPCTKTATLTMIKLGETQLNGNITWGPPAAPPNGAVKAVIHVVAGTFGSPDVGSFLWEFQSPTNDDFHVNIHFEASKFFGNVKFDDYTLIPADHGVLSIHRCVTGQVWFSLKAGTTRLAGCGLQGRLGEVGVTSTAIGSEDISLRLNGTGDLGRTGTVDCARP